MVLRVWWCGDGAGDSSNALHNGGVSCCVRFANVCVCVVAVYPGRLVGAARAFDTH